MVPAMGDNLDGYHNPDLDLDRYLAIRTRDAINSGRCEVVDTCQDVQELQSFIRQLVSDGIGGKLAERAIVTSAEQGRLEREYYTIVRLLLHTSGGVVIPCNIYEPSSEPPKGGRPAMVLLAGHYPDGKAHDDYQRAAGAFAVAGYVVAAFDPHGIGERGSYAEIEPGTAEHTYAGIQCWWWGLSSARYFLDDASRVIDLLVLREDVDPTRIVALGSSGGGFLTALAMALEPRLAGAAPATFVTSRASYQATGGAQDAEQILLGASAQGLDHDWLLMTMAPRPVCLLAADSDFFPIEGTLATATAAKTAWQELDAADNFSIFRVPTAHRLHPELADAALNFFAQTLDHPAPAVSAHNIEVLVPSQLACLTPGDSSGVIIHDRLLAELPASVTDVEGISTWLRARVKHARNSGAGVHIRQLPNDTGIHLLWQSELGIWGCGVTSGPEPGRLLLTDAGTLAPPEDIDGVSSFVMDVRGRGALAPRERVAKPGVHHAFASYRHLSDLLWLGDSLAAGQVWDVLWALEHVAPGVAEIHGQGYGAYLARLVAMLRPMPLRVTDEYVEPDNTSRLWDDGRGGWTGVLPGLGPRWATIRSFTDNLRV